MSWISLSILGFFGFCVVCSAIMIVAMLRSAKKSDEITRTIYEAEAKNMRAKQYLEEI